MDQRPIINKVAGSGLITLDLKVELKFPEVAVIDLKDHLWQGLALKEKDFREFISTEDWSRYSGRIVVIDCTADAVIPTWAYMLVAVAVTPFARMVLKGKKEEGDRESVRLSVRDLLSSRDWKDARVVVKGCSDIPFPEIAFVELSTILQSQVKSLMFGEPCSTVPVFKRKV